MGGLATGSGTVCSAAAKTGLNFYSTPEVATRALLRHEYIPEVVWEPLCGSGAIVNILREVGHTVIASDIEDRGCHDAQAGVDFLKLTEAPPGVDCILSNPPFNRAEEFIHHALYTLHVPKVIMLLRLAFLEAGNLNNHKGRCRKQVLDGGHLARVLLFRKRLPFMHQEGYEGKKCSNSGMPFIWGVWSLSHEGPTAFERISWEPISVSHGTLNV